MEKEMKTKSRSISYIVYSIMAAGLLLTVQISLAGSATWLLSPQDSAWENVNNWTPGGPPNGPSDVATFASPGFVNISTSEEVNSIVFTSDAFSFDVSILENGQLIIGGRGVTNNNNYWQTFYIKGGVISFNNSAVASVSMRIDILNSDTPPYTGGLTIFNDTSSAGGARIVNEISVGAYPVPSGQIIFNDASTADHATIINSTAGQTTFNDVSTAANATITNDDGCKTIFNGSSTADNATLAAGGLYGGVGTILFNGASTGGTARVRVRRDGSLDISGHQSGVTIGSIGGPGNVFLGANNLTVGTRNINTSFSGVISGSGSLAKVGSGVLRLRANDCIADTVGLILVSGSIIKLDFTGPPDVIASLKVNSVPQPPGIYGGPMSGAPNILPEFAGSGTVLVGPLSILGNISTRSFVQTGDNVVIGGFIVQGSEPKRVIIRAIGPELGAPPYNVPNALANPTLELHNSTGALIASNNNWGTTIIGGIITANQVHDIQTSGYAPGNGFESAIIADLAPGNYTAIVRGVNDTTGVALVEVNDLSPEPNSILSNISTRAFVQTGDNVMIGGFIIQGTAPKRMVVRAIGPELTQYGVPNPLANPTLELHDSTGALIAANDNWQHMIIFGIITSDQRLDIRQSGHAPGDGRESAIIAELPAGNYTAIVRGVNLTTGVALVEMYDLDQ
jgi:hypothetical protein